MREPMTDCLELVEGSLAEREWDDVDETRDVGDSNGGESIFSRFVTTSKGFSVLAWDVTGRMVSAKVLDLRSCGSVSVLARCDRLCCLRSTVSKCELLRWSTVSEERRRGTFTWTEEPRGEYVAGGGLFSNDGSCDDSDGFSFSHGLSNFV